MIDILSLYRQPSRSASLLTTRPPHFWQINLASRLGRLSVEIGMSKRKKRRWFPSVQKAPWAHGWPGSRPPQQFWRRLRWRIICRDNKTCQYCGWVSTNGAGLNVDHVIPVKRGGKSIPENLVTACWKCNKAKGNNCLPKSKVKALNRGPVAKTPSKPDVHCDSCGSRGVGYQLFDTDQPDYWMCGPCFGFLIKWRRKERSSREPYNRKGPRPSPEENPTAVPTTLGEERRCFTPPQNSVSSPRQSASDAKNPSSHIAQKKSYPQDYHRQARVEAAALERLFADKMAADD